MLADDFNPLDYLDFDVDLPPISRREKNFGCARRTESPAVIESRDRVLDQSDDLTDPQNARRVD